MDRVEQMMASNLVQTTRNLLLVSDQTMRAVIHQRLSQEGTVLLGDLIWV